ncbi:MAG: hypothetical protein IKO14_04390 [Oscillibacter sp.]|nr:hypothetical protein [Oscillibacter sp.]
MTTPKFGKNREVIPGKSAQRDFVLGLIEQALEEAEREAARTEETAAGQSNGADTRSEPGAEAPDGEPEAEEAEEADSAESAENAPAEAGEDADSGDGVRSAEWN